jgi:hypothetical protein
MRRRSAVALLLTATLSCTGGQPTEINPDLAVAACGVTITAIPLSVSKAPNTDNTATFTAKNTCGSTSGPVDFTASRTGAVASISTISPLFIASPGLNAGASKNVAVGYKTGAVAGTGTVVLTATRDMTGGAIVSSGAQTVSVSGGAKGVPFGPYDLFTASNTLRVASPFNLTLDFTDAGSIVSQINAARAGKVRFVPAMTGGGHGQYLTDPARPTYACPNNGEAGCRFDFAKWKLVQNRFNTTAIKSAVAAAVTDSTIPFSNLMDEPNHSSWGGVMTHALLDSMSAYSKGIFPTLKTGVAVTFTWQSDQRYQNVDVLISQYSFSSDTLVARYRDNAVASAQNQNIGLMFSLNLLDGGGRTFGTAQMSAAQVQNFGNVLVLAPYSCGLLMWTWNDTYMANSANKTSFNNVAATAAGRPAKVCGK